MLRATAPSAARTPISRVRSVTLPDEQAVDAHGRKHQRRDPECLEEEQREPSIGRRRRQRSSIVATRMIG